MTFIPNKPESKWHKWGDCPPPSNRQLLFREQMEEWDDPAEMWWYFVDAVVDMPDGETLCDTELDREDLAEFEWLDPQEVD